MNRLSQVMLPATDAGAAMPLSTILGEFDRFDPNWPDDESRHSVIAFGADVLPSAVSRVWVPE